MQSLIRPAEHGSVCQLQGCEEADELRRLLEAATTLPRVREVMAEAKASAARARDQRTAALTAGVWIESMVKADQILQELRRCGELAAHGGARGKAEFKLSRCKLADLEIGQVEAHRWRRVAEVAQEVRQDFVWTCLAKGRRVTVQGLLRFAAERHGQQPARNRAHELLQTAITSALAGVDRLLALVPEQAEHMKSCRERLRAQLAYVPLVDALEQAAVPTNYLVTPFDGLLSGVPVGQRKAQVVPVVCTAVLERTCVVHPAGSEGATADRMLVRAWELFVDHRSLRWLEPDDEQAGGFDSTVTYIRRCRRCGRRDGEGAEFPYRRNVCRVCWAEHMREYRARTSAA